MNAANILKSNHKRDKQKQKPGVMTWIKSRN